MSIQIINATEASRSLSSILSKVHYQGESYEIRRGKEVIAKIVPAAVQKSAMKVDKLNAFFKRIPQLEKDDLVDFKKDVKNTRASMKSKDDLWD